MKWLDRDHCELATGRRIYVYQGIFGVSEGGALTNGYDHVTESPGNEHSGPFTSFVEPAGPLTPDERREIAEFQVERWRRWGGIP